MRTTSFAQTIQRLDDMFAGEGQERMRQRLADSLRWCVAQCLVPTDTGGRIAALEVVQTSYRIQDLIRGANTSEDAYRTLVRAGRERGMQTADDHLIKLCRDGLISVETARHYVSDRPEIAKLIDEVQLAREVAAAREGSAQPAGRPGGDELKMDYTYGRGRR